MFSQKDSNLQRRNFFPIISGRLKKMHRLDFLLHVLDQKLEAKNWST